MSTSVSSLSSSSSLPPFSSSTITLPARDYDLAATLDSGQVFRWRQTEDSWVGIIGKTAVRLTQTGNEILAETTAPQNDWDWLRNFLQTDVDLQNILKTFPDDPPMQAAVAACHGLRILRQEPWECLASFILSSTKQIVQIRQIVANLCDCFGEPISDPADTRERRRLAGTQHHNEPNNSPAGRQRSQAILAPPREKHGLGFAFPTPQRIAGVTETDLRNCKMGFRAPNLLAAACQIAEGRLDLESLRHLSYAEAKMELMKLRGVGAKIADCVLLFAYGFDSAFPVDVWIERALRQLYFPRRRVNEKKLLHFAANHFGPHAGYAQQYLFHYMRTKTNNVGAEVTRL